MILVCGQNCAWQLIYRFERVTAGAVNRVLEVQRAAAGKGIKVARALTALGLPATLLAYLGGANGRRMRAALRDEGIAARVVETAADTSTCVALLEGPPGRRRGRGAAAPGAHRLGRRRAPRRGLRQRQLPVGGAGSGDPRPRPAARSAGHHRREPAVAPAVCYHGVP